MPREIGTECDGSVSERGEFHGYETDQEKQRWPNVFVVIRGVSADGIRPRWQLVQPAQPVVDHRSQLLVLGHDADLLVPDVSVAWLSPLDTVQRFFSCLPCLP